MRDPFEGASCPAPVDGERITQAHGGGRSLQRLLRTIIGPAVGPEALRHDSAVLDVSGRIALTCDSFVVRPRAFPGGDIGTLAVCGTVNDLVSAGARPVALTLGLILEEGLLISELSQVLASIRRTADSVGISVVTGDTKVVERGRGDGLYLNTAGVGRVPEGRQVGPWRVRPGDVVLVSGDIGRHGATILAARQSLTFQAPLTSDCAPILDAAESLWAAGLDVRCLRDPTRGGLGSVAVEIAGDAGVDVVLDEAAIPISPIVSALCAPLGLDPLLMACEGRLVAIVGPESADDALHALKQHHPQAARIGVVAEGPGRVWLRGAFSERPLILPTGAQLPRIC